MAITVTSKNATGFAYNQITATKTVSVDAGSGSADDYLVLCIQAWGGSATTAATTATHNANSMTKAVEVVNTGGGSRSSAAIFYIKNPGTGAKDVVVTWDQSQFAFFIQAFLVTGLTGTSVLGNTNSTTRSGAGTIFDGTVSLTTGTNGSVVFSCCGVNKNTVQPFTPASGVTEDSDGATAATTNDLSYFVGHAVRATAGANTEGATGTGTGGGDRMSVVAAEFKEATGGGGATAYPAAMAVGL